MAFPFTEENRASRVRLRSLVGRLSAEDLALTTDYGWTLSALFAHLAWWDQRVLILLRRWKETGVDESPVDSQAVNDALRPPLSRPRAPQGHRALPLLGRGGRRRTRDDHHRPDGPDRSYFESISLQPRPPPQWPSRRYRADSSPPTWS